MLKLLFEVARMQGWLGHKENCHRLSILQMLLFALICLSSALLFALSTSGIGDKEKNTHLPVALVILKNLISLFRCVWLGLVLNSAGQRHSRTDVAYPWSTYWSILNITTWDARSINNMIHNFSSVKCILIKKKTKKRTFQHFLISFSSEVICTIRMWQ